METKKLKTKVVMSALALGVLLFLALTGQSGNLEPGGPPGPTMKTLDEVEPRIPIQSLSGDASAMYVIDQPGSYYLIGDVNIDATDKDGIRVDVNNVTIDLMGYTLKGPGSGINYGIYMNGRSNVEIRNGTVRNFGDEGIYDSNLNSKGHRIIDVRVVSNGDDGIRLRGSGHLVKDCTAAENGWDGIHIGDCSTVTGNTAYSNQDDGIDAAFGCTVTGNTVYNNQDYGIYDANGCTVTGNTVYNNQDDGIFAPFGCTVTGNTAHNNHCGIFAYGCTVTGNTAYGNTNHGIYAAGYCLVDQNTAYGNGTNMFTGTGCQVGLNVAP